MHMNTTRPEKKVLNVVARRTGRRALRCYALVRRNMGYFLERMK
jgi:hypothetical protein